MNLQFIPHNKKASHAGMVISFVVFVTSLLIIYSIADIPSNAATQKEHAIEIIKPNIIEEISKEMIVVRTNDQSGGVCANFSTPPNSFSDMQIIATNSLGVKIPSTESGGVTYIENGDSLSKIYYMDTTEFESSIPSSSIGCSSLNITNILHEDRIFEGLLLQIITENKDSYSELKSKLEVSLDDDFNIEFVKESGSPYGVSVLDDIKTDIYVNEYHIDYISTKGKEENGVLKISVW